MCFTISTNKARIAAYKRRRYVYKVVYETDPGKFTGVYYSGITYRLGKVTRLDKRRITRTGRSHPVSRQGLYVYPHFQHAHGKRVIGHSVILKCEVKAKDFLYVSADPALSATQATYRAIKPVEVIA